MQIYVNVDGKDKEQIKTALSLQKQLNKESDENALRMQKAIIERRVSKCFHCDEPLAKDSDILFINEKGLHRVVCARCKAKIGELPSGKQAREALELIKGHIEQHKKEKI